MNRPGAWSIRGIFVLFMPSGFDREELSALPAVFTSFSCGNHAVVVPEEFYSPGMAAGWDDGVKKTGSNARFSE